MGRLLADQITDIANKPAIEDYDIEDRDVAVFEHQEHGSSDESDASVEEENNQEEKAHYVSVGKSKLRDNSIKMDASKYQGAKGSRDALFDADEAEGESDAEAEEESDAVSWKSDSEDGTGEELENQSGAENEIDGDNDDETNKGSDVEDDSELKRERLAKMVELETRQAVKKLSEATKRDAAKGLCILEQSKLFDNILDVRMKLQKGVTAANSLPLSKESWSHYESKSPNTSKLLRKTTHLLEKILGLMVDFREEFQINDHISQTTDVEPKQSKKRKLISELGQESKRLDNELKDYRSAVLNKWSNKITAASGKSALNSSKFKAINQPADVQVENQLSDMDRLIKRTCISRRNIIPLRFQEDLKNGRLTHMETPTENDESKTVDADELDIPKNYDPRRKDNVSIDTAENPYIFDDEDFYRTLLNDLVDKKMSNAKNSQGGSATIAITTRSNNRLKKNIDTKASKGRKLNYSIQEPIANFEAPRNSTYKWSDEQIDEFFAGLLGQKINFNEDKDMSDNEDESTQEAEAVKNDDIQIFG